MKNEEQIEFLSKLIDNIKSGQIKLINLKEKKNKDGKRRMFGTLINEPFYSKV